MRAGQYFIEGTFNIPIEDINIFTKKFERMSKEQVQDYHRKLLDLYYELLNKYGSNRFKIVKIVRAKKDIAFAEVMKRNAMEMNLL